MIEGRSFTCALNRVYDELVQWKRNLFKVPSGNAGKAFVRELSRMFNAYAEGSALECVAMKAAMTMPAPKLMMEGKVHAALRLVTQANGSGPLPLNTTANPNDPKHTNSALPHGNVYALSPSKVHLLTCENLWQPLPDEFASAMLTPVVCHLLSLVVLLLSLG